jgi:membrane-bound serine protease (ClpP class)
MKKSILHKLLLLIFLLNIVPILAGTTIRDRHWQSMNQSVLIYEFAINKEIGPAVWRITQQSFKEAIQLKASLIIIHLNTYGGALDAADSIRTKILNCPIPVYVYIDNNAASAGALISIAADRIYMRSGASIGAATVVNQTGEPMPDKYQSFMRSMMRSTAEYHGKDTIIHGMDTTFKWKRDPLIAEAMVDPRTVIPNVNDSGKVLSFTTEEAIKHGYCEGKANSVSEVIKLAGIKNYEIKEYKLTTLEKLIGFLINPILQGILIMIIVAGVYFEMQSPGIAFPILAAITAAFLYFAPLYLQGIAQHWEMILFVVGLILIGIEIFVIPGFGITGISGIALVIIGLTLSMIDKKVFDLESGKAIGIIFRSLFVVMFSMTISLVLSIYFSSKIIASSRFAGMALKFEQSKDEGYVSVDDRSNLVGAEGIAATVLRLSGKVEINGDTYDAISEIGYINQGEKIKVNKYESGQLYVVRLIN